MHESSWSVVLLNHWITARRCFSILGGTQCEEEYKWGHHLKLHDFASTSFNCSAQDLQALEDVYAREVLPAASETSNPRQILADH